MTRAPGTTTGRRHPLARFRLDRGTVRAAGFVALLTVVFLVTNTSVAAAADGSASGGGLLAPLDVMTGEGVPLSSYQLEAVAGKQNTTPSGLATEALLQDEMPDLSLAEHTQRLVLGGLFTLVRLLVGLCCWLIAFVFRFPLLTMLSGPAQEIADAYQQNVVAALGLEGLLLAWAFVFGLILFVRGKVGSGLGEIALTLVIAALAASAFVRPDYLLGKEGPLAQTHQAAIEVAAITTDSYFADPSRACANLSGPSHDACVKSPSAYLERKADAKSVVDPIQAALADALVVKPYMLLQYGRTLDPKKESDAAAYRAHLKWVQSNTPAPAPVKDKNDPCQLLDGPSKAYCQSAQPAESSKCDALIGSAAEHCKKQTKQRENCDLLDAISKERCLNSLPGGSGFRGLLKELDDAGPVGKQAGAYARQPSWDRVWAVVALLVAVIVVALMVVSMAMVMLGAQGADAVAAAGGPIAWVWSMLPGPSRMLLWRWLGVFLVSALVSFVAAMALPMFAIAVDAVLAGSTADRMIERLLLVDAIAAAFLVMHRRVLAATAGFGQRLAGRMRFKKVGGSHMTGDSSELGAALAMHGGGGGGMGGGPSPAHGAFGSRLQSLGSLAAMSDSSGMAMSPGRFFGDALAEGRRGIAPLAMALRGAHSALIGPRPGTHPASRTLSSAADGGGAGDVGEMVVDRWSGEVLHDPATDRPLLGSRLHARASRLRGYRVASRTVGVAYGATFGLPRNVARAWGGASQFTSDALTHLRVASHPVRERVDHAGQVIASAWQVHDPVGAARSTAVAAAIATAPLAARTGEAPRTRVSAPRAEAGRAPRTRPAARPRPAAPAPPAGSAGGASSSPRPAPGASTAGEANAARLRARFEAHVADRRRREGGGQ
ncbi:hypothetical protein [Streptomyces xanthophaeus]|uniref:hypothetical protein n=1 Tax=Streptomyces xanthophaeus TaxID=67385 RepID=UPI00371F4FA6